MAHSHEAGDLEHLKFTKCSSLVEEVISSLPEEFSSSLPKIVASQNTADPLQDLPLPPLLPSQTGVSHTHNSFILE